MARHVLIFADSLSFYGPTGPELLTEPRLYPNVLARMLDAEVDVVARLGMTSRDAWWALTKDPNVYSLFLPRADAVVLAVGSADAMPASLPTYLRDGIPYLRPGWLRRRVRETYLRAHPYVVRATGGRLRVLPQYVTEHYLERMITAIEAVRPGLPVVVITPAPHDAPAHGRVNHPSVDAAVEMRHWARRRGLPLADFARVVGPYVIAGATNPDGMHWSWPIHAEAAAAVAAHVRAAWAAQADAVGPTPGSDRRTPA